MFFFPNEDLFMAVDSCLLAAAFPPYGGRAMWSRPMECPLADHPGAEHEALQKGDQSSIGFGKVHVLSTPG